MAGQACSLPAGSWLAAWKGGNARWEGVWLGVCVWCAAALLRVTWLDLVAAWFALGGQIMHRTKRTATQLLGLGDWRWNVCVWVGGGGCTRALPML